MKTRIMSALLALVMVLGLTPVVSAFAADDAVPSDVVMFHEELDMEELTAKAVLCINYSELEQIADMAKDIVDTGTMLVIASPEISSEDVATLLSIPKTNITSYQSLLLTAYSIYRLDDKYIFANHYATFATEGEPNEAVDNTSTDVTGETDAPDLSQKQPASNFSNVLLMAEYLEGKTGSSYAIDPMDAVSTAISARADMEETYRNIISETVDDEGDGNVQPRSVTIPSITATESWNDNLYVYGLNNTKYGYINCTVYGYGKGTGVVNGSNKKIYDVVSVVKAYPESNYKVKRYQTQIRCNFTNFNNLQTTTLPSGTSYSQGLSLTGSYGPNGGSGGGTFTTSWTYNPESQVITESSSVPRVVKWKAEPANPTNGKAYDIAPGMRVASPTNKMRGAFSKVFCDAMILGFTVNANSLEVGGWF